MKPFVESRLFGELANGEPVMEFTLDNGRGMLLSVLDYGCILRSWRTLARHAPPVDFVLGFDTLLEYERDTIGFGALRGRPAFRRPSWQAHISGDEEVARVSLCRLCKDGEDGLRGNVMVMATYELGISGELRCCFQACSDQPAPLNITQLNYFNLTGEDDILGHELCVDAEAGEGMLDFRLQRRVGSALMEGGEYNFVLAEGPGPQACLCGPATGRRMDIYTDCPRLLFDSGSRLDATAGGKGRGFTRHAGLRLEPQQAPGADCRPGAPYSATTRYVLDRWR